MAFQWTALLKSLLATAAFAACCLAHAGEPVVVEVPSLDRALPVPLPGALWRSDAAPSLSVVLLHGCSGMMSGKDRSRVADRYRQYGQWIAGMGMEALAIDSFTPRGLGSVCGPDARGHSAQPDTRRLDAMGAVAWLRAHGAARVVAIGWSHGAMSVLALSNAKRAVDDPSTLPDSAVLFYPGCVREAKLGYAAAMPVLAMLGELDDWTPASPCLHMLTGREGVALTVYAGAYHGFDSPEPVKILRGVSGAGSRSLDVHMGGDPQARADSHARLQQWLADWAVGSGSARVGEPVH